MKVITITTKTIGNVIKDTIEAYEAKKIEDKGSYYAVFINDNYEIRFVKDNYRIEIIG